MKNKCSLHSDGFPKDIQVASVGSTELMFNHNF